MTPSLTPLHPSITHTTSRLTHADAATHLEAFLAHTDAHPAYRPDSTLSSAGPVSASASLDAGAGSGGSGGTNLTLVHLRRVLAGMRGRRVGGAIDIGLGEEDEERPKKKARVQQQQQQGEKEGGQRQPEEDEGVMTWQDKDDFELAQDELLEDDVAGEDSQAAPQPASVSGEVVERPEEVVAVDVADDAEKGSRVDKEARKRDKKDRKAEKKKKVAEEKRKRA